MLALLVLALALVNPNDATTFAPAGTPVPETVLLPPTSDTAVAQEVTILSPYAFCSDPLTIDTFGANELNGLICKPYLLALIGLELGIVDKPVQTREWSSSDFSSTLDVLSFFDERVRYQLANFEYNGFCSLDKHLFLACAQEIPACNQVDDNIFETVDFCKETCEEFRSCTGNLCTSLDAFDIDNTTHCVATLDIIAGSAATLALSALLALLI